MDSGLASALGFAVQLSLKATAVLAVSSLCVLFLHRSSAASRHLAASLGLLAAAVLPLAALLLPRWEMPVLPRFRLPAPFARSAPAAPPLLLLAPDSLTTVEAGPEDADVLPASDPAAPGATSAQVTVTELAAVDGAPEVSAQSLPRLLVAGPIVARSAPGLLERLRMVPLALLVLASAAGACALWLVLSLSMLLRLGLSAWKVRQAIGAALPAGPALDSLLPEASASVRLTRKAELLVAPDQPVAMTAGARRPVVLLPESAHDWPRERSKVVLLHELAHVARRDWEWLLVSELALAIFWFHPLAWWLHRSVRRDAEQAADDRVLEAGTRPSDYASHLLALVRSLSGDAPAASMAMARTSGIESRLRAILDGGRSRLGPSRAGKQQHCSAGGGRFADLGSARRR
jgi:BlaR1 peptidase M56